MFRTRKTLRARIITTALIEIASVVVNHLCYPSDPSENTITTWTITALGLLLGFAVYFFNVSAVWYFISFEKKVARNT